MRTKTNCPGRQSIDRPTGSMSTVVVAPSVNTDTTLWGRPRRSPSRHTTRYTQAASPSNITNWNQRPHSESFAYGFVAV